MYVTQKEWKSYINKLWKLNQGAAQKVINYVDKHGLGDRDALIAYANSVVQTYGTGSAALSAAMYDATAAASGVAVPAAELAPIAEYGDVAKTVNGVLKSSSNVEELASAVARWVKKASCDTTLQNAVRDARPRKTGKKRNTGAQFAWVPSGDTCAYCLALAANGWQNQTVGAAAAHAEHIHSNCDCTYAVRFSDDGGVAGYDPDAIADQIWHDVLEQGADDDYKSLDVMYHGAFNSDVINAVRRENYAKNKDKINAQKRDAYEKRQELNSSQAEESEA